MTKLTAPMLNRLTLPQLKQLADQAGVTYDAFSEKDWIVSDILHAQDRPIPLTAVHDALLRHEKATDNPTIASARQLVKEFCLDTHDRTTLDQLN